ncbi:MAG: hypothetical protein JXA68_08095 [Ignavibacteriales bacterium]|nr:hypothetical protein [Ignavibacteriales bacterium]
MKKLLFATLLVALVFFLSNCEQRKNKTTTPQDTKTSISGNYLGSDYNGNYVWGGAMNLAWNELNENILQAKLELETDDSIALEMADKLNNPVFTKNDLDEASYYIKSGYGQGTVDLINKETKEKFPQKCFADLDINLGPEDIISYAYFLKEVEYVVMFKPADVTFNSEKVKGFCAESEEQKKNIEIIEYASDEKFIIKLKLKDNSDELILAKGYNMNDPQEVVAEINLYNKNDLSVIGSSDKFEAPKLHLDYRRDYMELVGKCVANKGFEGYCISQMFENIKFDMDEKGARVENEAVIVLTKSVKESKNFILDQPYWVVMKRADSQNPYFILGVNNTKLMEVVKED